MGGGAVNREPSAETTSVDAASVDPAEIAKFTAMAEAWWDPRGKFRPLHKFNPTRIAFIRDRVAARFGRDSLAGRPFEGLRLLDVGCGGGLLAEPMARLGAQVTGLDAAARNIAIARSHAAQSGLDIDYRCDTVEALATEGTRFDVVLNMEVVEHVADLRAFLSSCCELLKPNGVMIVATLNRTPKAFALAVVGAEYVLRWLPRGTHDWRKFVRPSELAAALRPSGVDIVEMTGVSYNPLSDRWSLSKDLDVNYMIVATPR
ncbi:bifunctional 2-polyprenyl-6-hydroxyphenol methylase/3-demethylubiquinol 3-O-methyltransferase UbiG [Rhodospirillaceae bacterium SYSU D60014]|uniref:bifunctional 2-polyprenyl-6-hydroxyphenol methylase/3-demethylubiquinol 3-O-methyltransferase UbiG n=1 Tax=Virgifigura deserti TaxID=2268457 RepID=UPI000E669CE6